MRQIYISHSHNDEPMARALEAVLEMAEHTVWRHTRTQLGGWRIATAKSHLAAADDVERRDAPRGPPRLCADAARIDATREFVSVSCGITQRF